MAQRCGMQVCCCSDIRLEKGKRRGVQSIGGLDMYRVTSAGAYDLQARDGLLSEDAVGLEAFFAFALGAHWERLERNPCTRRR